MFPMEDPSGGPRLFIQLAGSVSVPKRLGLVGLGPVQDVSQALVDGTGQVVPGSVSSLSMRHI